MTEQPSLPRFLTVGHSDHPLETFLDMLREAEVSTVVDVRRLPGSRKYPWFDQQNLAPALEEAGTAAATAADQVAVDQAAAVMEALRTLEIQVTEAAATNIEKALEELSNLTTEVNRDRKNIQVRVP